MVKFNILWTKDLENIIYYIHSLYDMSKYYLLFNTKKICMSPDRFNGAHNFDIWSWHFFIGQH